MSNSSKIDIVSTQKRMLVVLDCFQDHQAILNIASHLAVKQKMEISALFVEDVNLVHLAGLPFAREVDRVSHIERQMDQDRITSALAKQARQIEKLLKRLQEQSKLQITLDVVRGHFTNEAMSAVEVDLLLLNKRGMRFSADAQRDAGKAYSLPLWVLYDGSPAAERALLIAGELAQDQAGLNVVLKVQSQLEAAALKEQVQAFFSGAKIDLHFYAEADEDFPFVLQNIKQRGCRVMVLGRQNPENTSKTALLFAEKANCLVLVVS